MKTITKVTALAAVGLAAGSLFHTTAAAAAAGSVPASSSAARSVPASSSAARSVPASSSAAPSLPTLVAYVRAGDVYVGKGATEIRLTRDGGYSRPRFSPDGKRIALLNGGHLWIMKVDGSGLRRLTTRAASGASFSPDGTSIAFASLSCTGGPGVYRIAATVPGARPEVLFPSECRGEAMPAEPAVPARAAGRLSDRLRYDDAVAWSPDGAKIAFRGGNCEAVYDACLSIGTVSSGAERTVAAYGGGSLQNSGFAVVPAWRADGVKLAWTAYQKGEVAADDKALHLVEYDTMTGAKRVIGATLDREMAYLGATRGVVTGQHKGGSWLLVVDLTTGARTPFRAGSQPDIQPIRK